MLAAFFFFFVFDQPIDILNLDQGYQLELAAQKGCAYDPWHESTGGYGVLNEHKKRVSSFFCIRVIVFHISWILVSSLWVVFWFLFFFVICFFDFLKKWDQITTIMEKKTLI